MNLVNTENSLDSWKSDKLLQISVVTTPSNWHLTQFTHPSWWLVLDDGTWMTFYELIEHAKEYEVFDITTWLHCW